MGVVIYSRVIVSSILGIDYMVVLRGANEVLITIMRSMLYVSPHNKVTKLTNLAKVMDQGLCYCDSAAGGWHHSYQSGVISIPDQLFYKMKKSSKLYRRNNNGPKTLPCCTPDTTLTSLLRQPSKIMCCDRFDRNCVNIDKTEPPISTEQSL